MGSPVTEQIPRLPFFEVRMGLSCDCSLSSSLFLFSLSISFFPVFHELCSLCFQDTCIFFTLFLDGNTLSLPFISLDFQYGRCIFIPSLLPALYDGLLSITYPVLTEKLQLLQRSGLRVRFVSISVFREMRRLWVFCFLNCTVKQCSKRREM